MSGDESIRAYESLIDATLLRFRDFDRVRPPEAEALSPSDRMVTLCPRWDVDSDDVLDRIPGVTILNVEGPLGHPRPGFRLRRPHPNIEGLMGRREADAETIGMLPGLRFAQLVDPIEPGVQDAFPTQLEELWTAFLELERLSRLSRLRFLRTKLLSGTAGQCRSLARVSSLRILRLFCAKPLAGVNALGNLEELEELEVDRTLKVDLKAFSRCRHLRQLFVGTATNVSGFATVQPLESLALGGRQCPPLGELRELPRLGSLNVATSFPPADLEVVGELTNLRALSLAIGSVLSPAQLPSTRIFSKMHQLETLHCQVTLKDKDLSPLAELTNLKYLMFLGTFPPDEVRRLQEKLPGCKIDLTTSSSSVPDTEHRAGPRGNRRK